MNNYKTRISHTPRIGLSATTSAARDITPLTAPVFPVSHASAFSRVQTRVASARPCAHPTNTISLHATAVPACKQGLVCWVRNTSAQNVMSVDRHKRVLNCFYCINIFPPPDTTSHLTRVFSLVTLPRQLYFELRYPMFDVPSVGPTRCGIHTFVARAPHTHTYIGIINSQWA